MNDTLGKSRFQMRPIPARRRIRAFEFIANPSSAALHDQVDLRSCMGAEVIKSAAGMPNGFQRCNLFNHKTFKAVPTCRRLVELLLIPNAKKIVQYP